MIRESKRRGENTGHKARARSGAQEKESARRLGGQVTPASGAMIEKGDVRVTGKLRVECKTTANKSFSVTREMVDKIEKAAVMSGEVPAIEIEFLDSEGVPVQHVALVPLWVLNQLV